jgi:hypothetical protein
MRERGLFAVMVLLACGDGRGPDTGLFGSGEGSVSADDSNDPSGDADGTSATSGSGSASVSASADDAADSGGDGPKFDTPDGATMEGGDDQEGCEKIDFLFAIDNSCSMGAHQQRLIQAFPSFIDTIFSTVQAQDYQIMVTDSDADGDISGACEPCTPDSFWCDDWCTAKAGLDLDCETALGAGEVAPYNNEASNTICGVPGDRRYLTAETDQATTKSLFQCMGKVGIFGSGAEMPMSAMAAAVTTQSQPGGCNEGFVRDDAILVVTVISDDYPVPSTADDASTVGSPQAWYDAVVQAKGGNPDNVVMLGIINTPDAACVSGAGDPIVHPTERFMELVSLFGTNGLTANICASDYNAFFEEAVGLIDQTCDEFVPEG